MSDWLKNEEESRKELRSMLALEFDLFESQTKEMVEYRGVNKTLNINISLGLNHNERAFSLHPGESFSTAGFLIQNPLKEDIKITLIEE